MKKINLVKLKDLEKISDKLGDTINVLESLEPFLTFKERCNFKRTYGYIKELYFKVDKVIINMTDKEELDKK
ncbi:MAG: hypothetical protein IJ399_04010 [Bacilli bacterium]|nr:hypothetical protein [Bacilli bacterium]